MIEWHNLTHHTREKFLNQGINIEMLVKAKYYRAEDGEFRMVI